MPQITAIPPRLYSVQDPPSVSEFDAICHPKSTVPYPHVESVEQNVPIFDLKKHSLKDTETIEELKNSWNYILLHGPGVFVVKHFYEDLNLLRRVNDIFSTIITKERQTSTKGDHFAAGGKNDRIWNSFGKHGLEDPSSFVEYYSNPWLAHICEAWLGPAYKVTAQVNVVKPGGAAQVSHRDYHLGFQTEEACSRFPRAMQIASQLLTLQGAVAHTDMPLDSGPTRLLPFSQRFEEGYMAYRRSEFVEYFMKHHVNLPLELGDGIFFNPALFHAAGENKTSDFNRIANLIQVSSAFGKTMETVDSLPLIKESWDDLTALHKKQGLSDEVMAFVAAVAEGYPFPTNLDRRPPAPNGMAPESEQDIVISALKQGLGKTEIADALSDMRANSQA